MNADKAAEQILAAYRGDAEITLTLPAKLAARLNALFPNTFATLLQLTNRLLPAPAPMDTMPASVWKVSLFYRLRF